MYNNNDEMMLVDDFDADIKRREELLAEIKAFEPTSDWNATMKTVSRLQKSWKKINYGESAYEDKLEEEFQACVDAIYAKRKEGYAANAEVKQALVNEAKEASKSTNWNKGTEKMNELMNQWKASGSAGKEKDDELWEAFNEARQFFFDAKRKFWEEMKEKFEEARNLKEKLVEEAKELADSEEWQKTNEKFKELMNKWKAAGNAGRDFDDKLWAAFNESRQNFYTKRTEHYAELHEKQNKCYEEKKALVEKAAEIVNSETYNKNNTEAMKALSGEWKKVGFCGKDKEDDVWKEFRTQMDAYFDGLRKWNDQKHENWLNKMKDARNRKAEAIANQKRQIKRLENDIVGLLGERAIRETEETIEQKKELITQLEKELAELDETIAKN